MRDEWFVARRGPDGNKRYGPVPLQQLRTLVDGGKVQPADLVWREGMANWLRAEQCDELFPAPPGPRRSGRRYDADEDDRPSPRRRYPQQQSSGAGWIIALVVGGVVVLCVVACGGVIAAGIVSARSTPASINSSIKSTITPQVFPIPLAEDGNHGAMVQPAFGGPAVALGQFLAFKGGSQLYYTADVTQEQAQLLGDTLDDQGVFPEGRPVTVQVTKLFGTYQVRFCVKRGAELNPDAVDFYKDLRDDVATNVFPNETVEVHLCGENMNTVRTLRAGD